MYLQNPGFGLLYNFHWISVSYVKTLTTHRIHNHIYPLHRYYPKVWIMVIGGERARYKLDSISVLVFVFAFDSIIFVFLYGCIRLSIWSMVRKAAEHTSCTPLMPKDSYKLEKKRIYLLLLPENIL